MPAARTTKPAPGGYRRSASSRQRAAAPRRATPQRRATAKRHARATPLRIRWERVGRVALLVVLVVVLGLYVQQGLAYLSVRSQADQQAAIVKRLKRQNTRLTRQENALNDPATIVRDARALGMIRPGERPYVVTGLSGG